MGEHKGTECAIREMCRTIFRSNRRLGEIIVKEEACTQVENLSNVTEQLENIK